MPEHLIVRELLALWRGGHLPQIAAVDVEPTYGYAARVVYHDGGVRLFYGSRLDVNTVGAARIADDKGYSKAFLSGLGYRVPRGQTFLLADYAARIGHAHGAYAGMAHRTLDEARGYVEGTIGWPCYVKPNDSAQGEGVFRCESADALGEALAVLADKRVRVVLVEEAVEMPDYRVVVYDGAVIAAYARRPLTVTGDGVRTVGALLADRRAVLAAWGRWVWVDEARVSSRLMRRGYTLGTVLAEGEALALHDVANLSAGGELVDYTDTIHPQWAGLCVRASADMGLRLCGVDLMCEDITRGGESYALLELNASPGMGHYAASGEQAAARVRAFICDVFR